MADNKAGAPPSTADQKEKPVVPLGPLKLPEGVTFSLLYSDASAEIEHAVIEETAKAVKEFLKGEGPHRSLTALAAFIREVCVQKEEGVWHVIVGPQFGSYVTHEAGTMLFFEVGPIYV
jgi:dynein light chain LC8-type